ncbi:hypothetical protein FJZ53_01835 [Candidatus Woesearchaeota archaeon]|nr:hypothetical protein [Candidatus Woesearchaeota archaeon]
MISKHDEQRMQAVDRWADYVISHDDWSKHQKVLIDSQVENARRVGLTKDQVEYIRGDKKPSR